MRLLYAHDVPRDASEGEAEFDTPATTAAIVAALRSLGHEVETLDAGIALPALVARVEAARPELVFNVAEGRASRFREAVLPALLERMGIPFTGSDAYVCALTMDKRLTKRVVAERGVPVAPDLLARRVADLESFALDFPAIVKPNHEGSSMGIGRDSVVEDMAALRRRAASLLERYPDGVLVEQYVAGRDVAVPYLAGASPATGGVLEPVSYRFDGDAPVYGLDLKTTSSHAVVVEAPARIQPSARTLVLSAARAAIDALGVRDLARLDFRVREDGSVCFLEINALPSLEPGAGIYLSAALAGLTTVASVLDTVVRSAALRYGLRPD